MTIELPYSAAAERNASPLADKLTELISVEKPRILEIGSGTGQHVAFFAERFSDWSFQPSDQNSEYFDAIRHRTMENRNVESPLVLDLLAPYPNFDTCFDVILAINVFQVAPIEVVDSLYSLARENLNSSGIVLTYSPLTHAGRFTSEGDQAFNARLKERDPRLGIRSFEELKTCAEQNGFSSIEEYAMPANNWLTLAQH